MQKHLLLLFSLFLICSFNLIGQANPQKKNSPQKAAKGTYQFIVSQPKAQVAFGEEILYEVEKNRHDTEVKFLQLGEQAKVKILPRSEINSPGFVPLKEEIVFEK